ncbi:MAG: hypothetical protein OTJ45_07845 [Alphaproteobacteria bacterium]|nr:hypothetical protein [Alphaproteobacteria bacterium]
MVGLNSIQTTVCEGGTGPQAVQLVALRETVTIDGDLDFSFVKKNYHPTTNGDDPPTNGDIVALI